MRCTEETEIPEALAIPRELQCVAFSGMLSRVFTMTASISASSIVRGAPERGIVTQSIQAVLNKAAAPLADCSLGKAQTRRDLPILQAPRAFKNNPRSQRQGLPRLAPR